MADPFVSAISAVMREAARAEKAEAEIERLRAAICEWVEVEDVDRQPRAHADKPDEEYGAFLVAHETRRINAVMALRAIAEEARRG